MIIEQINDNAKIALWHITEDIDKLLNNLDLNSDYIADISEFTNEKRKKEYLAVRCALQEMCGKEARIKYLPSGEPYLNEETTHISITHTGEYAAIILGKNRVGIDVERISDKVVRVKHKFLSPNELNNIDNRSEKTHLALLWAAKEALYKVIGVEHVDFVNQIQIKPFQPYIEGEFLATQTCKPTHSEYKLKYKVYPEFVMVWTVE